MRRVTVEPTRYVIRPRYRSARFLLLTAILLLILVGCSTEQIGISTDFYSFDSQIQDVQGESIESFWDESEVDISKDEYRSESMTSTNADVSSQEEIMTFASSAGFEYDQIALPEGTFDYASTEVWSDAELMDYVGPSLVDQIETFLQGSRERVIEEETTVYFDVNGKLCSGASISWLPSGLSENALSLSVNRDQMDTTAPKGEPNNVLYGTPVYLCWATYDMGGTGGIAEQKGLSLIAVFTVDQVSYYLRLDNGPETLLLQVLEFIVGKN